MYVFSSISNPVTRIEDVKKPEACTYSFSLDGGARADMNFLLCNRKPNTHYFCKTCEIADL